MKSEHASHQVAGSPRRDFAPDGGRRPWPTAVVKHGTLVITVCCLSVTGGLLQRLVAPVWLARRAHEPALRSVSNLTAAGPGLALALLGGFRALIADAGWIRLYANWEKRDLPATDSLIQLVPAIDPRSAYFWLNGARIMAYDFAAWRIEAAGGYDVLPRDQQDRIVREQARRALRHLDVAMKFHPARADLWIERANIELNRIRDVAAAAESYRRASEQPDAPYYAARLHAEMLRRLGRNAEALAWLKRLHPTLPEDHEAAAAGVVLARIREFERQTGVPAENSYHPPP